ncbi:MAG TPA: hypothetical protein VEW42_00150 [Candidatus Eisenbacteria bacterium]|nr:hypothetical protein [Candidatus Eisenbacteria bacterium]
MQYRIEDIPVGISGFSHLLGGAEAKRRARLVSPEEAAEVAAMPVSALTPAQAFFRAEQVMQSRLARGDANFGRLHPTDTNSGLNGLRLNLETANLKKTLLDRARGIK